MRAEMQYSECNGIRLLYWRWGDPASGRPPAILLHGTAFCGATWRPVAEALAEHYVVYALDRRGHGRSDAPKTGYEFHDFADDLVAFADAHRIEDAYGIGHSAGGTDFLLAATRRPRAFSRLVVMEPTMTDIAVRRNTPSPMAGNIGGREMRRRPRRAKFESKEEVFTRYSASPLLGLWRPDVLREYVEHGFEEGSDGSVHLRCAPEVEMQMLDPIGRAMMNSYTGDVRGDPFPAVRRIGIPVLVTRAEFSPSIYHEMAYRAVRAIPQAKMHLFRGTNHCVPQENPDALLRAIRAFAVEANEGVNSS